jgi:vanillate O-demethylase ferredoxin subunit
MTTLYNVVVRNRHVEGGNVAVMEFESANSATLPKIEAGAHIDVHLPNGMVRQYSLCQNPNGLAYSDWEFYVILNHVVVQSLHLMI